jgi:DNA-binding HxlR family transcriptional regulator
VEKRRNYRQFCGLAKALDQVGERWTLLIVRNLLLGPRRYSDLLEELPGITTNLLAARLRDLTRSGLLVKRRAASPQRAVVYELGPSGRALEPAIMELARWGGRYLDASPGRDTSDIGWLLLSLKRRYRGGSRFVAAFVIGARQFELAFEPGYLGVTERETPRADVRVTGGADAFRAWLFKRQDPNELRAAGKLGVGGDEAGWTALTGAFRERETPSEALADRYFAGN